VPTNVPGAGPLKRTSPVAKPVTGMLKTTVKWIGDVCVGSFCPAAWLIVTKTGKPLQVTLLSVLVEAVFKLPAKSLTFPAGMEAISVPSLVIPLTDTT